LVGPLVCGAALLLHGGEVLAVLPHTATARSRPQHRRVDRQHGPQTDVLVLEEQHLLVAVGGHVVAHIGLVDHRIVQPPSTISTSPVTYDDASETRKTTGPTNSSGRLRRPRGVRYSTTFFL